MRQGKKSITFEVPVELIDAFNQKLQETAHNKSALFRRFILEYVQNKNQSSKQLQEEEQ